MICSCPALASEAVAGVFLAALQSRDPALPSECSGCVSPSLAAPRVPSQTSSDLLVKGKVSQISKCLHFLQRPQSPRAWLPTVSYTSGVFNEAVTAKGKNP